MPEQVIICPHCQKEIPLTEAISHQIREKLLKEFELETKKKEQEFAQREQSFSVRQKELEKSKKLLDEQVAQKVKLEREKIEKETKQKAEELIAVELKDLRQQIKEKEKKLSEAQQMELELRKQRRELEESKKAFEVEMTRKVDEEREKVKRELEASSRKKELELAQKAQALTIKEKEIGRSKELIEKEVIQKVELEKERLEKEAKQKAAEGAAVELKDLREQIGEKERKLQEAQKAELELRKQRRELQENKKAFELEMTRKLDEEREKIKDLAVKSVMEEYRLKDLEKEKRIVGMRKQIEELKRRAEQGSQQIQGEVLELELEDILKAKFPLDHIEPVPKGIKGADVLQKVHNQSGQYCGTIVWESKRTKAWSDGWIAKLKDDQREVKAEIAVLMTTVLPKDVSNFAYINRVWVTSYASMDGLATALRINLIQVANTKLATVGKNEKMEVLYNYLSGPEFRQKVEAIVEAFVSMKKDIDQEKRAMMKIWSKRDKEIERVINNTVGMYGDMQGIIGASLPQIKNLELKALTSETNEPGNLNK